MWGILQIRVPVNATKPDGATALFLAAQEGHAALVKLLLKAGAAIDMPDEDGISPLCEYAQWPCRVNPHS